MINKNGQIVPGFGTVCGYREKWLILGLDGDDEGCIKQFTSTVVLDNSNFKSYRFWNIRNLLEYNTSKSGLHPNAEK